MLGYKPEEWTSDPDQWIKIMHPADRERVLAEVARTDETGDPFRMEFRQFARDGRVVWVRDEAVLVRDEEGNPSYWLGFQYDITKRKRSEEAREESELRLRTVISNVPVVLFAIDFAGVISLSEGKGMGALGLEPGEVVGRSISEVFGGVPGILEDVDRALAGETLSTVREGELADVRDVVFAGAGEYRRGHRRDRRLHRHNGSQAGGGGAEGERRTLPQHLRERSHRHGPRQPR